LAIVVVQSSTASSIPAEVFDPYTILNLNVLESTPTRWFGLQGSDRAVFEGIGLTNYPGNAPSGGIIHSIHFEGYFGIVDITGLNFSGQSFFNLMVPGGTENLLPNFYSGDDTFQGSSGRDYFRAFGGNDSLSGGDDKDVLDGGDGNDTVSGGAGSDVIRDASGANYLRGDEGDDSISGGANFDDINGNLGNDTASGGDGDDWVVGGKDNDSLSGGAGGDVVWGNLGNDTQDGGDGNDQVRGGQGDDSIGGGAGDDYVSGDRGNDTVAGGTGADLFHGSQDAGIDRVVDFSQSEGDRVFLDPGTTYTVSQVGADTVIDMGAGHQMILVGVQLSSLTLGWIFGA
jgi:Ca2+-binding RTX toxin-like protein